MVSAHQVPFWERKPLKARPSSRGRKCKNAEPPFTRSNRISSKPFLMAVLTTRSAFVVRGDRGVLLGGSGVQKDLPPEVGPCRQVSTFGPAGAPGGLRNRVWGSRRTTLGPNSKIIVFLKENIGFSRSRVLPSGSREGGLGVPGTSFGRRRAPSVCSEDDFGPSGDDLGQL